MCRSKIRDNKRNVHEMINSASNGSDLDLSPGENLNLFIDLLILTKPTIYLGPKSKTVSMKIDSGSQVTILPSSICFSLIIPGH